MSQINRPPLGLQRLLGSQSFGQNPNDLLQQVRPNVDLLPFWGANLLDNFSRTDSRTGEGEISRITFDYPIVLLAASIEIEGVAAAGPWNYSLQIGIGNIGNVPAWPTWILKADQPNDTTWSSNDNPVWATGLLPQPLVLEAGVGISFSVQRTDNGGLETYRQSVLFYRLGE